MSDSRRFLTLVSVEGTESSNLSPLFEVKAANAAVAGASGNTFEVVPSTTVRGELVGEAVASSCDDKGPGVENLFVAK